MGPSTVSRYLRTLKKDQVLDLVEEGLKARAISEELGIDVETVQRWRDDPNSRP